ncbi:MAG: hypothetical protein PHY18_05250 [Dehalococcoidales bacterium]|nr:hypothetical protein [Dehalococcoidales bacterium]
MDSKDTLRSDKEDFVEELPTIRPGDRVLRRMKRSQGKWSAISQGISRLLRLPASKKS